MTRTVALTDAVALPCGQQLPNRFMKSALSEALADSRNRPTERLERLYARWANGGYGLVVTGNVQVDGRHLGEPGNVVVEDDSNLDSLKRWAAGFKEGGTPLWMQINHPGRQSNPLARSKPVAPSAIAAKVPGATRPRELTDAEIVDIIERFATTAAVAEAAGFDGVQIHGAHGYLVTQFLSPLVNQRTDRWGGDATRRRQFVLEIVRRIRSNVSPGFAVGIKLNSADFQRGGFTEDESRDVVRALVDEGIDMIEVSGGSYEAPAMMGAVRASTAAREAYFLDYARSVADLAGSVPIAVTGGFRTLAAMAEAVSAGDCDIVGLGRPACTTPDAPSALLEQRTDKLTTGRISLPMSGRIDDLRKLESLLDLQWHTDQMHRMGDAKEPDHNRQWWQTLVSTAVRNGTDTLRPKRG